MSIVVLSAMIVGCAPDNSTGTTAPTTTLAPSSTTTTLHSTTSLATPSTVPAQDGSWPAGVEAALVAGPDGVSTVTADGVAPTSVTGPTWVAVPDGAGGLVYTPTPDFAQGRYLGPSIMWLPGGDQQAMKLFAWDLELVSVVRMHQSYRPTQALIVHETNDMPGDVCATIVPVDYATLGEGFMGDTWVTCRRPPQRITWVSWSGRFLALTVEAEGATWFEFADEEDPLVQPSGWLTSFAFNPAPQGSPGWVGYATTIPGTNLLAYASSEATPPEAPTDLVVIDLDDGREVFRTRVAEPGTRVDRIDAAGRGVAVSITFGAGLDEQPLEPLLADLDNGTLRRLPVSGWASIVPTVADPPPVLFAPRVPAAGEILGPDIVVTSPARHSRVHEPVVRFTGLVTPGSRVVAASRFEAAVDDAGAWSLDLVLNSGGNVATFTAIDPDGHTTSTSVSVAFDGSHLPATDPLHWVGTMYRVRFGGVAQEHPPWQIVDDWAMPPRLLDLWMRELGGAPEWSVRLVADEPLPGEPSLAMLWATHLVGTQAGEELLAVTDVMTIDTAAQPNLWLVHDPTGMPGVIGEDGSAWSLDSQGRFVAVSVSDLVPVGDGCEDC